VKLRRLSTLAVAAVMPLGLGACHKEKHPTVADNEATYIDAGPITYQVQLSRQLSPYDIEDQQYLRGISKLQPGPNPQQEWFAIFLWGKNQTKQQQVSASTFDITDTQGNVYHQIALSEKVNPYAWTAQTLDPGQTQPQPGSLASTGPTQGEELLFRINISAYSNRPLTFEIRGPAGQLLGQVSLDL
jgi:hypothetical protein